MKKLAFNNKKYLKIQREEINKRIKMFDDKLYLEFGGKLFDDFHASRVLPGFKPDSKLKMLLGLKDKDVIVDTAHKILIRSLSVRDTEDLVKKMNKLYDKAINNKEEEDANEDLIVDGFIVKFIHFLY